jgi:hypothetical protein
MIASLAATSVWLQAAVVEMPLLGVSGPLPPNLRSLLLVGDFFLGGEQGHDHERWGSCRRNGAAFLVHGCMPLVLVIYSRFVSA